MTCNHDEYDLTEEQLFVEEPFNVVFQQFVCLDCGVSGERTYKMPIEITWEDPHQTKLEVE